jgi:hypothetical protein
MQRGKEHQRRAQRKPPVEVLAPFVEALPESDDREQIQQRLRGQRARQQAGSLGVRSDRREHGVGRTQREPREDEDDARRDRSVRESARPGPAGHERRRRDERPGEQTAGHTCPGLRAVDGLTVEDRGDREEDNGEGGDQEAGAEEEVETPTLDREANPGQQGDDPAGERHHSLEHEAELGQRELRLELMVGDEEGQRGPEQAKQEDFSPEPGLEVVSAVLSHVHSCRQIAVRR